ncbi:MAG: MFS transporter [Candidatus Paceibacterota bacterium]
MLKNIKIIYLAGFLFAIPIALTSYINSSFLKTFVNKDYVGLIYIIASIITIWGFLNIPKLLSHIGNKKTSIFFSILIFLSLISLAFTNNKIVAIISFVIYFTSSNLIITSLDVFIEHFSKDKSTGKFRGIYLTIINLAWVIAQTISSSIISKSSFKGIYLFASFFIIFLITVFIFLIHDFKDPEYKNIAIKKTIKSFLQKKRISKVYLINFILKFFYAWMVIYTPIYLNEYMHFDWKQIGFIFSIMLIPFILLDYPLGKLSDKTGEKKMLIIGFLVIIIFTILIPLTKSNNIWTWALILFGTRVGAAIIEIMSEVYFFKIVKEVDANEISFFRNNNPLAYIIAPLLAVPILLLIPSFEYMFYILGAILLFGLFITIKIKDVK